MKGNCQRLQHNDLNSVRTFSFFGPKNVFDISISWGRTGKREVSTVRGTLNRLRAFSFFCLKNFSISRFLGVAQVKGRCMVS